VDCPGVRTSRKVLVLTSAKESQGTVRGEGPRWATSESEIELVGRGMWEESNPRQIGISVGRDIHVVDSIEEGES